MPGPALPKVPTRRNVKVLTDAIAALQPGADVSAMFLTKRYGAFTIEGTAFASASVKSLTVGGRFIEQNLKPHKSLQALQAPPADSEPAELESAAPAVRPVADAGRTAPAVHHGDLVLVRLIDPAYGPFTVTGVGVASTVSDVVLVGGWFISRSGAMAPRVASVEVLARGGTHDYPLPPRIASWGEESEGATEY